MVKRTYILFLICSIPLLAFSQANFKPYSSYQAINQAQSSNKYIFVSFEASWCQPCQWMKKNVYTSSSVISKLNKDFVAVKSDMSTPNEWSTSYDVKLLPYVMILDEYGNKIADLAGSSSVAEMSSFLDCKCQVKADPMPAPRFASYEEERFIDDETEKYWTIQVGKYVGPFYANRLRSEIENQFDDVHVRRETSKEGKEIYRVFIGYFGDERSAKYSLDHVRNQGYKGFIKYL